MHNENPALNQIAKIYSALTMAIRLLLRNSTPIPQKAVYPVLLWKDHGPQGLYIQDYRILAYNIAYLPDTSHQIAAACELLDLVAHELAHEYAPNHGFTHEQWMERYLHLAKGSDIITKKYIIEIIRSLILRISIFLN